MKTILTITWIVLCHLKGLTQDINQLTKSTCECLQGILTDKETLRDKVAFQFAHEDCFKSVYTKAVSLKTTEASDAFLERFYEKISDCEPFNICYEYLDSMTLEQTDSRVETKSTCKSIMRVGEFEDMTGSERVTMSMRDSVQLMTFGDPTVYTKSRVVWEDDCTYTLVFIESTNPFENSILKMGDKRTIRIIDILSNGHIILETGIYDRWFLSRVKRL